ncbi:hypothetical protein D3C84_855850 [compost metagenome]
MADHHRQLDSNLVAKQRVFIRFGHNPVKGKDHPASGNSPIAFSNDHGFVIRCQHNSLDDSCKLLLILPIDLDQISPGNRLDSTTITDVFGLVRQHNQSFIDKLVTAFGMVQCGHVAGTSVPFSTSQQDCHIGKDALAAAPLTGNLKE